MTTTEQLMSSYRTSHNSEDFQALYDRTHGIVRSFARRYMRGLSCQQALIDEIVQDVYMRVISRKDEWSGDVFLAWFFTIIRTTTFKTLKREKRRSTETLSDTVRDSVAAPESVDSDSDFVNRVLNLVPAEGRDIFEAHYLKGESLRSIARQQGVHVATLHQQLQKHIRRLQFSLV